MITEQLRLKLMNKPKLAFPVFNHDMSAVHVITEKNGDFILALGLKDVPFKKLHFDPLEDHLKNCFEFRIIEDKLFMLKNEGGSVEMGRFFIHSNRVKFERDPNFLLNLVNELLIK